MSDSIPLIVVVDDDESVREALAGLLQEFGLASKTFASAEEFIDSGTIRQASCLIVDIAMPGMSGPELRDELAKRDYRVPIIFVSAHAEFASQPDTRAGVVDCLTKPFSDTALLMALKNALPPGKSLA